MSEMILGLATCEHGNAGECARCRVVVLEKQATQYERALGEVIDERDIAYAWADKLAFAIGQGDEGEHSNLHNPWAAAEEIAHGQRQDAEATQRRIKRTLDMLSASNNTALYNEVRNLLEGSITTSEEGVLE